MKKMGEIQCSVIEKLCENYADVEIASLLKERDALAHDNLRLIEINAKWLKENESLYRELGKFKEELVNNEALEEAVTAWLDSASDYKVSSENMLKAIIAAIRVAEMQSRKAAASARGVAQI